MSIAEEIKQAARDKLKEKLSVFEPTGILEPAIKAFGSGDYDIVVLCCANKLGKTTLAVNILKNIFWEHNRKFFDYKLFKDFTYPKSGRIVGTATNTSDSGPIKEEMQKWWPPGRFTGLKLGKNFECQYDIDTGFKFDVMTYEQKPMEFEGPLKGWTWLDEPPPSRLVGPIMSRFSKGGVVLITMTPIDSGPIMDILEDMEEQGTKIKYFYGSIWDNSITKGPLNSTGTKRGLMTDEEIERYIPTIPPEEKEARLDGKPSSKSGKVFPMFDKTVHIRDFQPEYMRTWNTFMVMDPHNKYYPACSWWGLTPEEAWVCYNEWPRRETLGNFYDQVRRSIPCNLSPKQIAEHLKICDMHKSMGMQEPKRVIDPRFAAGSGDNWSKSTEGITHEYAQYDIQFRLAPFERIQQQRLVIQQKLQYDPQMPVTRWNQPDIFVMPHCENMIRSLNGHYWDEGKESESEKFKDFIDGIRYILATFGHVKYETEKQQSSSISINDGVSQYRKRLGM